MLVLHQVSFRFAFRAVLREVSVRGEPGELIHIVGPNGVGKSTLMSIMAGLRQQHKGTVEYRLGPDRPAPDRRRYIEFLPAEANALYGKSDAMSNLRYWQGMRGHDVSDECLVEELRRWELDHPLVRSNFPTERFSTGMKRRLALARVQLSATPCWLLDEPLYGLDSKGIKIFQTILQQHLSSGGQAWIVSHDTSPFDSFAVRRFPLNQETST